MWRAVLCLGVLFLSGEGLAVPVCDDDSSTMSLLPSVGDEADALEHAPAGDEADDADDAEHGVDADEHHIIPCAFVESGAYGPVCLDASGYLVTTSGVVLCEVRGLPEEGIVDAARAEPTTPAPSGLVLDGGSANALCGGGLPTLARVAAHREAIAPVGSLLGPGRLGAPPRVPPA